MSVRVKRIVTVSILREVKLALKKSGVRVGLVSCLIRSVSGSESHKKGLRIWLTTLFTFGGEETQVIPSRSLKFQA